MVGKALHKKKKTSKTIMSSQLYFVISQHHFQYSLQMHDDLQW
jgi:hypothetical protein